MNQTTIDFDEQEDMLPEPRLVVGHLARLPQMRQVERKGADKVLIVSHGTTIRTFVMRFMHLTVEDYESMRNPKNCDIITISDEGEAGTEQFRTGRWGVSGLRLRGGE